MNKEFPELHDFFGAYFHQDWTVEHETPEQVIDAFIAESGINDVILVKQELEVLIDQKRDELPLRSYLLQELSCYYCYWDAWGSGDAWLRHLADRLGNGT